ncbi:MAG TPA: hypothetical protein VK776_25505 [Bryobacteraceae bacterium]|nr:hypothetical protein [Bryobacteraceae bacterium]
MGKISSAGGYVAAFVQRQKMPTLFVGSLHMASIGAQLRRLNRSVCQIDPTSQPLRVSQEPLMQ